MANGAASGTPFFSVIIPTYNRAEKVRRALESLVRQSFQDFEVLVCDDGSTDGTATVVKEYEECFPLTYLWEENRGGPAWPRNRGVARAGGEWVCFLDADDWWYPEKLAAVRERAEDADLIHHDCDVHTPAGKTMVKKRSRQSGPHPFAEFMTLGCSIVTSSVCARRRLILEAGGFPEERELIAIEDFDLWLRLALRTDRFLHLPRSLGAYWVDDNNISHFSDAYIARETAVVHRYLHLLEPGDRREAELLLLYKTGIARKHLGRFAESRRCFLGSLGSRRGKIKLYSLFYLLLSLVRSRYTIP